MIQRWINKKQYICFSIDELFSWQDRLDELEENNNESEAWNLFNDFLNEAENHLEYSEEFLKEMEEIHKKIESGDYSDFIKVDFNELIEDDEEIINEEMTNMECLILLVSFGILFALLVLIIIGFLVQLGWIVI